MFILGSRQFYGNFTEAARHWESIFIKHIKLFALETGFKISNNVNNKFFYCIFINAQNIDFSGKRKNLLNLCFFAEINAYEHSNK